jgi:hypothetical protein
MDIIEINVAPNTAVLWVPISCVTPMKPSDPEELVVEAIGLRGRRHHGAHHRHRIIGRRHRGTERGHEAARGGVAVGSWVVAVRRHGRRLLRVVA